MSNSQYCLAWGPPNNNNKRFISWWYRVIAKQQEVPAGHGPIIYWVLQWYLSNSLLQETLMNSQNKRGIRESNQTPFEIRSLLFNDCAWNTNHCMITLFWATPGLNILKCHRKYEGVEECDQIDIRTRYSYHKYTWLESVNRMYQYFFISVLAYSKKYLDSKVYWLKG